MRFKRLLDVLLTLKFTVETHESHPEETTLHHVSQTWLRARKESNDPELWVAALFHDIGKTIETHGHENLGVDILQSFGYNNEKVLWLIKNHMRMRFLLNGRLKKYGKIQKLLTHLWLPELVHLRRVDGLSRKPGFLPKLDLEGINNLLIKTNYVS